MKLHNMARVHSRQAGRGLLAFGVAASLMLSVAEAGTLKAVLGGDLQVLDPIASSSYPSRTFGYMVYDTLISPDAEGVMQPQMLEGWTVSADGMEYVFTLRPGLVFSDGAPVTPTDVIASLKRWGARDGLGGRLLAATETLAPLDERSFALKLSQPFGLVIDALGKQSSPIPFIMPADLAATEATTALTEVRGSGPFLFLKDEFVPGSVAAFVPNPNYVPRPEAPSGFAGSKKVNVERVELISMLDPASQVAAMQTGEIDYLQYPSFDLLPILQSAEGVIVANPGQSAGNMGFLRPNHLQPPFDKPAVRQAFIQAVDRVEIMTAAGIPTEAQFQDCVSMFYCGGAYESKEVPAHLTAFDLEAAKKAVAASGYAGEEIVILANNSGPSPVAGTVLVQQLERVGMKARVETLELNTLFERRNSKAPVAEGGWSAFIVYLGATDTASPATHLYINNNCNPNYAGWSCDEEMAALQKEFIAEPDLAKRQALAVRINALAHDNVAAGLWGSYAQPIAYRDGLKDFIYNTPTPVFWNVSK